MMFGNQRAQSAVRTAEVWEVEAWFFDSAGVSKGLNTGDDKEANKIGWHGDFCQGTVGGEEREFRKEEACRTLGGKELAF